MPQAAGANGALHVFMPLGDTVGSTSFVIDHDTGELVERVTYQPFGGVESDYRPSPRWGSFREDLRYTGHWDDAQVGLVYFGARYYSPQLARFISPDPLTVHGAAGDLNPYAFVGGSPMRFVDPFGLFFVPGFGFIGMKNPSDPYGTDWPAPKETNGSGNTTVAPGVSVGAGGVSINPTVTGAAQLSGGGGVDDPPGPPSTGSESSPGPLLGPSEPPPPGNVLGAAPPARRGPELTPQEKRQEAAEGLAIGVAAGIAAVLTLEFAGPILEAAFDAAEGTAPVGLCFAAGTLIWTPEGERPIEEIRPGDLVWSRDEVTGKLTIESVDQTYITSDAPVVAVAVDTETLRATPSHPFWVDGRGWTPASDLSTGDVLELAEGEGSSVTSLRSVGDRETVFNLNVHGTHTYFVGSQRILVHNTCAAINITAKGFNHVLQRHVTGGALTAGKSLFSGTAATVRALITAAAAVAANPQANGNFQRIVTAAQAIGVDRVTGAATAVYTVITNAAGELITAFPGTP